jgi:hypothetical protein
MSDWYIANAKDMQWFDAGVSKRGPEPKSVPFREDFLPG